jgi:hypothetical protein
LKNKKNLKNQNKKKLVRITLPTLLYPILEI